jgi:cytochrome c
MIAILLLRSPICGGKSSTSGVVWVGGRLVNGHAGKLLEKRFRRHETGRLVDGEPAVAKANGVQPGRDKEPPMKKPNLSTLFIIAASTAASGALAQDADAGKTSFNKCLACHAVGEGAKNKVGPVLNGIDGRKSGSIEGYSYSDANKNSGITWNKDVFLEYIKDPKGKIPGTKMVFAGIKNEKEANDLWAYLSQYDKDGKTK